MLTSSRLLLRRRGQGHVVKYLEGVPTPSKLIDHLAGANLHASAELPFYNTVPRYVDVQREQRLSQLFFHHVLYPAGGARLPYQAVVVRGGRAVRSSTPRVWNRQKPGSTQTEREGAPSTAASSPSSTRPRANPLAVPASQLGSSSPSATALMEEVPSSATWARVDPARRPYFSTKLPTASGTASRHRNTHADNGPAATNPYLSGDVKRARHDPSPLTRAIEDDILKPLRGVVEHYWNSKESTAAAAAEKESGGNAVAARLERLLVSPSGGLLWLADGGSSNTTNSMDGTSVWERLVTSLRRQRHPLAAHSTPQHRSTFTYVQTRLPPSATVVLPVEHNRAESPAPAAVNGMEDAVRCRMAGGVEPVVPFAVGRPLRLSGETLFSHITCLTRVDLQVAPLSPPASASPVKETESEGLPSTRGDDTAHNAAATRFPAARSSSPASPAEPWKLGPDGLDLMVPQHVRTVAEHHPAKSPSPLSLAFSLRKAQPEQNAATATAAAAAALPASGGNGRYVVGRSDAETYLLPQRELLLTLYVPTHTEDMCAAQNNDRLQRQVRAGRAGGAVMAWPTEQARMTSARRAHGQYANAESAGRTGNTLPSTDKRGGASSGELVSRTSHEVRALPGDVVYIPRGWGYDVQRILGTATIHIGQRVEQDSSSSTSRAAGTSALRHDFRDNRTLSGRRGSPSPSGVAATDSGEENMANLPYTVEAVAVDAFCLHYHPYPELTAAQADVYVAANYVHAGVEQFYENGGNDVFRAYSVKVEPYGYDKMVWLETDQLKVGVTNYAASVASVQVYHPSDKKWIEVNCGYPKNPEEAYADQDYMGATVGRSAGRVAGGVFELDGTKYYTQKNRGENTCHCGDDAYHKKHWGMELIETKNVIGVRFNYTSPHMESGFPAEVKNYCTFTIERSHPNSLKTIYDSYITDHSPADASPINIFSHTSFNLNGIPGQQDGQPNWVQPESVRNHWVRVPASYVAEADRASIPTGEFLPVEGTIFDFREGRVIGDTIDDVAVLDRDPCGYDHPLKVDGWEKGKLMFHGEAKSPLTKIHMKVYSTFPCMWVYTANNKPLPASGGPGQRYARWTGLLVGPQNFSDCSNYYAKYPNCIVRRGEEQYSETTINEFIVE